MQISLATNSQEWDSFLNAQAYSPFLQSWTMGEVYQDIGEEPIRLEIREGNELVGICQAIVVHARRGKHLAVPYGPVVSESGIRNPNLSTKLIEKLMEISHKHNCSFFRISPFLQPNIIKYKEAKPSPLHLLAEHVWYLPLVTSNHWLLDSGFRIPISKPRTSEDILKEMRGNHRNLIRRADREGVEVIASQNPKGDIEEFFRLYDETRKRHHFVPYPNNFIRAQVKRFSERNECTLYLAKYNNEVIAASVHMHMGGETSYHHGASTHKYPKVPASYALQWKAIRDALDRGDSIFSFWGISPEGVRKHPFAGVRTFKTGFGGELLEIQHCFDIPVSRKYYLTRAFETWRKWRRGF